MGSFLDETAHLYRRSYLSIRPSVRPSVHPSCVFLVVTSYVLPQYLFHLHLTFDRRPYLTGCFFPIFIFNIRQVFPSPSRPVYAGLLSPSLSAAPCEPTFFIHPVSFLLFLSFPANGRPANVGERAKVMNTSQRCRSHKK